METDERVEWLRRTGIILVAMTFALMVLGSWVKATGSGASCPDWPTCYGEWFPPYPSAENGGLDLNGNDYADAYSQAQIIYEMAHRWLAVLVGIPLVAFIVLAVRDTAISRHVRALAYALGGLMVFQGALGAVTVIKRNTPASTTAHLAMATLLFFAMTLAVTHVWLRPLECDVPAGASTSRVRPGKFPGEE